MIQPRASIRRDVVFCLALAAINVVLCAPLFGIAYLDDFQSNEGTYITFAHFLLEHWPHVSWFPWFNAGMPFENTYLPLTSVLTAAIAAITHCSPARALHLLAGLAYSLAPVFLYLFAVKLSCRRAPSFAAALAWSLCSPSALAPNILEDMGTPWGLRRLQNIVTYGETPHNLALCLLPVALLLLVRFLERMTPRRFALAALAGAAVMASNAFGIVVLGISSLFVFAARDRYPLKQLLAVGGILLVGYLAICRFLPPTLIALLRVNSQLVGGDYRFTRRSALLAAALAAVLALLWLATRRLAEPALRFAMLFTAFFGGVTVLSIFNLSFLPQPGRYHIEMEMGLCLTAAFVGAVIVPFLLRREIIVFAVCVVVAAVSLFVQDYRYARNLIHPADITRSIPFREARWISAHMPGQRIFAGGEDEWWFNLFAENPQLSAGHEPSALNYIQRVAVYTIRSGENAGPRDAAISILWLKAFGCGAVTVAGPTSKDHYHGFVNPAKFDGLLPLAWREEGDSIYQVPLKSTSLAHVIPASAVVSRRPVHGLDVDPLERYVAGVEDPAIAPSPLTWDNPDRGHIQAHVNAGEVISVQMTYDPGWQARVNGRRVPVHSDGLGLMIIEPKWSGDCAIDLEFTGGLERGICLVLMLLTLGGLTAALCWNGRRNGRATLN